MISINGGVGTLDEAEAHLKQVDGVMLGRAAYHEPALLGQVDRRFFGAAADIGPFEALEAYRPYMETQLASGVHLPAITRHMLGLMHGLPGARAFRRILTVESIRPGAGIEVLDQAIEAVRDALAASQARRAKSGVDIMRHPKKGGSSIVLFLPRAGFHGCDTKPPIRKKTVEP